MFLSRSQLATTLLEHCSMVHASSRHEGCHALSTAERSVKHSRVLICFSINQSIIFIVLGANRLCVFLVSESSLSRAREAIDPAAQRSDVGTVATVNALLRCHGHVHTQSCVGVGYLGIE